MTAPLLVDAGPLVALLSERDQHHDADFTIYRKNGRQVIPLVAPFI